MESPLRFLLSVLSRVDFRKAVLLLRYDGFGTPCSEINDTEINDTSECLTVVSKLSTCEEERTCLPNFVLEASFRRMKASFAQHVGEKVTRLPFSAAKGWGWTGKSHATQSLLRDMSGATQGGRGRSRCERVLRGQVAVNSVATCSRNVSFRWLSVLQSN